MSARKTEQEKAVRPPRETADLFGHREAETALLTAYRSGRIPHAWLIGGPQGIGKATLAYRMARFVLAHGQPLALSVQRAEDLAINPDNAVARQVAASSHGGLLTLERTANDRGVMRTVITVDETRETIGFFGSTAAAEGWRVCIVDTVDELNPNAANALLKILEEPPQQSLILLVRTGGAAGAAEGSGARALTLLGGDALKLQQRTAALLARLPQVDPRELHTLGESLGTSDRVALAAFIDGIDRWIAERLHADEANANQNLPRLARLAEVWEKIVRAARDTETYNLERKPLVFSVFGWLADATR